MGTSNRRDPVIAEVRRADPAKVRVLFAGGAEPKELAVTAKKQRWATLRKSLEALPGWIRLECLRRDGGILCIVDNPDADAGDLEDLTDDRVDDDLYRAVGNQSRIILRCVDMILHRTNTHQEALLDRCVSLLGVISDRMVELERMQVTYLERMAAEAFSDAGSELMSGKLVEAMAPELMKRLMAPGPKNGARGGKAGPGRPPQR